MFESTCADFSRELKMQCLGLRRQDQKFSSETLKFVQSLLPLRVYRLDTYVTQGLSLRIVDNNINNIRFSFYPVWSTCTENRVKKFGWSQESNPGSFILYLLLCSHYWLSKAGLIKLWHFNLSMLTSSHWIVGITCLCFFSNSDWLATLCYYVNIPVVQHYCMQILRMLLSP